jgi:ribosomal protein S18 acetylase RimI-like enzyme
MIEFEFLSPAELIAHKDGLIAAYQATYAEPPYDEPPAAAQEFGDNILMSADRPGFQCVVARRLPENRIIGFATGSACLPLNWWYDTVTRGLSRELVERWFSNAFELVELGVIPTFQGQGIGSRLHRKILSNLNYRTAVLNVLQADIPAFHLYQTRGWVPIRTDFLYKPGDNPCTIMGLDLAQFQDSFQKA